MYTIASNKWVNWLFGTSLILILILGSIFYHSFNRSFYHHMYTSLNTASSMSISQSQLDTATSVLLDYIVDARDDLEYQLPDQESFFNEREIDHMVDVKNLYQSAYTVFMISLLVFLTFSLIYLRQGLKVLKHQFSQSFKVSFILFGLIIGLIALYAAIDFDGFWTNFHKVFFRNDLWILNPQTDRLIQMVPQPFFNQLVFRIVFTIVIGLILLYLFSILNFKRKHGQIHIVLFEPEIPQNTGNIMRTAMATNAHLHLIEPMGFIYDDKRMRRSGMDYIDHIQITRHDDYPSFLKAVNGELFFVTRYGEKNHSDFNFSTIKNDIYLVFGKESTGLPLDLLSSHLDHCMRIPMASDARSLNLANSVAIVTYEVLRQLDYPELSLVEVQKGSDWLRKHQ